LRARGVLKGKGETPIGGNLLVRGGLTAFLVTLVLGAACLSSPALAAGEHCPNTHGGPAAINWGIDASEQLSAGYAANYENSAQPVNGLSGVTSVKAGFKFGLALMGDCTLRSWGTGNKGQLGNGAQPHAVGHPVTVQGLTDVKEIAVANAHAMALRYDGTVWTWGASEFGERGNKEHGFERTSRQTEPWFVPRDHPTEVPGLSGVTQIAAGGTRDFALLSNGEVMAWGDDQKGQLGVEEGPSEEEMCFGETHAITPVQCDTIPRPVKVSGLGVLTGVERIGTGEEDAFAIRAGGHEVLAWGGGSKGQLGNGENKDSASPVRAAFEPPSPVQEVTGGGQQVLARLASGEVYAWGADGSGQLGFETENEPTETCGRQKCSTVPMVVTSLNHVIAVAAGEAVSFALKEEEDATRVIYSFGGTGFFELLGLGNQPFTSTSTPTPIEGMPSVRGIATSSTTAVALLQTGAGPAARVSLTPAEEALTVHWHVQLENYKLRDRPVGTRNFSKTIEGSCKGECEQHLTELKPEPYEVSLKIPLEGREKKEKVRKIIATPLPPKNWPANLTLPTISGSPATETGKLRQGQTLKASTGTWSNSPSSFTYQWLRCEGNGEAGTNEEFGSECEPILVGAEKKPATGETYEVQTPDVTFTVEVRVEAKNVHGASAALSSPELILASEEETEPPYPTLISAPTITGSAIEGHLLTAQHGSWENSPTAFEDKWFRCKGVTKEGAGATCSQIKNTEKEPVIGETYTPTAADDDLWVEVQERAINAGGWETTPSLPLQIAPPAPPTNITPPSISGTLEQGETLTTVVGTWTNAAKKPTWQWLRCSNTGTECGPIAEATKQTHTIEPADVGHELKVTEMVENDVGKSEPSTSAATVVVPVPPPAPEPGSVPTITGTLEQGQTLTSHPATWVGEVKHVAYQWKRCDTSGSNCNAIGGANEATYTLRSNEVGKRIEVKETDSNAGGSGVATSAATTVVVGHVPVTITAPNISGLAKLGQTLTEHHGTWGDEPTSFTYQWNRCNASGEACETIGGATEKSYVTIETDLGHTLRVEETAHNATGASTPARSAASAKVLPAAPTNTAPPTITGTAQQGETLTAHKGEWTPTPSSTAYQWLRCEGEECVAIEGATEETYVLQAPDVGNAVAVRETAKNAGGFAAARSEADPIGGPPVPFVNKVEPSSGPVGGGTVVTITGGNFAGTTSVAFGFNTATFEIISPNVIKATSPSGSVGSVAVTVTTPEGTSEVTSGSHFKYGMPPATTEVQPKEGSEEGGASIKITGSNLGEATAVRFGAGNAQSFGVQSSTSIIAVAPPGSGTVGVTVTTPYGSTTAGSHEQFTYVPSGVAPVVKKRSAKKGPAAGGTAVTIIGKGFINATGVSFGQSVANSFEVISDTEIAVKSPPGTTGTVDITVSNAFGTSAMTSADHFKYEKPTVTGVSPSVGPKAGGTLVTVTGSGFALGEGKTAFVFGKAPATAVECMSTSECTMISPPDSRAQTVKVRASVGGKKSSATEAGNSFTYQ
jgi:alpha-tubulin suppressor-like RCC1 family protein